MQGYLYICRITLHMVQYTSQFQTKITEFSNLCNLDLNPTNRWFKLSAILPWDQLVNILLKKYDTKRGAKSINPRIIIGAVLIKHMVKSSDEETINLISESPYMQFFLGLTQFQPKPLFSPSLFVEIRKKLGKDTFDEFNRILIQSELKEKQEQEQEVKNRGKLKIDATVADQYIRYPNDLSLVNEAREKTEVIVDMLYEQTREIQPVKPRTYRKVARKRYLEQAKKRQKNKKEVRKALRYLLNCVNRNLGYINKMVDMIGGNQFPLEHKYQRQLWVIKTLYDQQKYMYDQNVHRCDDRIVSVAQPHVRPIVRGKQGRSVEFGSKLGLSVYDGYTTTDNVSWDAYNEGSDLIGQAEAYRTILGHYPDLILADKIYWTNENRKWCTERNIRMSATPKGKPKEMTPSEKRKRKKEFGERNHVEGKIGNAKQAYSLNQIKAKLKSTSEAWIGATIFAMNVAVFLSHNS